MTRLPLSIATTLVVIVFSSLAGNAQWLENGISLSRASGNQTCPKVVTDGMGGAIVIWLVDREVNSGLYIQRVRPSGEVLWQSDGVVLCDAGALLWSPRLATDNTGGAIVTWCDSRAGNADVFAQRVDNIGSASWVVNGLAICANEARASRPHIAPDSSGGAIVVWSDVRSGDWDIYAQRINASGDILWQNDGVPVVTAANSQYLNDIVSDGIGGVFLVYFSIPGTSHPSYSDCYIQHIDAYGVAQWDASGVFLGTMSAGEEHMRVAVDGAGGAIVVWTSWVSGQQTVHAQRIDDTGAVQWPANGVLLSYSAQFQEYPQIVTDGSGGAIVAWLEYKSFYEFSVRAQRVCSTGNLLWWTTGVEVCTQLSNDYPTLSYPSLAADGSNGAIVAWKENRTSPMDVYAQRITSAGTMLWQTGGVCISAVSQPKVDLEFESPAMVADNVGNAIVAWHDWRNDAGDGTNSDIYAQRVQAGGQIGPFAFADATVGLLGDEGRGRGVAWGDYDGDGDLDLYLANWDGANKLFRNEGAGEFVDVTVGPLADPGYGTAVAWGDYDNDGDLDLYVVNRGGANKLLRNDGDGGFVDATTEPLDDVGNGVSFAWGDYDGDGDLDLYLVNNGTANKLFRNEGGGTFVDVTCELLGDAGDGQGVAWGDYDNDGDLDLYLTNGGQANKLFRNDGDGVFVDATNGPLGDEGQGRGVAWGDYDNDGKLDLYVVNGGQANKLFRNEGGGVFADVTVGVLGDTGDGRDAAWGDYDNDGDLDLYIVNNGEDSKLLRNDGEGVFADVTSGWLGGEGQGRGTSWGDYDGDGRLDLYLSRAWTANKLLRNVYETDNHWSQIKLIGTISNRAAIGARVIVVAGDIRQIREVSGGSGQFSQNSLVQHFGLGAAGEIDSLIVRWPSGIRQVVSPPPAVDNVVTVIETDTDTAVGELAIPQVTALQTIAPNPFNPVTIIRYGLAQSAQVRLTVFDLRGRLVRVLVDQQREAGYHETPWDGTDSGGRSVASGVYMCRMEASGCREARRLTMVK